MDTAGMRVRGSRLAWALVWMLGGCASNLEKWSVSQVPVEPSTTGGRCDLGQTPEEAWPNYFPRNALAIRFRSTFTFQRNNLRSELYAGCFYSAVLHFSGEPRLWPPAPDTERYRFTWIRSFLDDVVIRVEQQGAVYRLHVKQLTNGPDKPHSLVIDRSRLLTPSEWSEFLRRLHAMGFWGLRARRTDYMNVAYTDGSTWLLEGAREGRYKVFNVFTPDRDGEAGAFRDACLYLVELAGLSIPEDDIY